MTVDAFLTGLEDAQPGFVPFQPYVCGMTRAPVPVEYDDPCIRACVYVYFGDLEGAHEQLQALEGDPEADFLHGIIHRREGDFSNATYWFRQASKIRSRFINDPEALTTQVSANKEISEELSKTLFDEFKTLLSIGLGRLKHG